MQQMNKKNKILDNLNKSGMMEVFNKQTSIDDIVGEQITLETLHEEIQILKEIICDVIDNNHIIPVDNKDVYIVIGNIKLKGKMSKV